MKAEVILNGTYKIVLIPENEIEKGILDAVAKMEVEVKSIEKHTQILDKVIQNGIIITNKKNASTS